MEIKGCRSSRQVVGFLKAGMVTFFGERWVGPISGVGVPALIRAEVICIGAVGCIGSRSCQTIVPEPV